jgi:hypothetical protein
MDAAPDQGGQNLVHGMVVLTERPIAGLHFLELR